MRCKADESRGEGASFTTTTPPSPVKGEGEGGGNGAATAANIGETRPRITQQIGFSATLLDFFEHYCVGAELNSAREDKEGLWISAA